MRRYGTSWLDACIIGGCIVGTAAFAQTVPDTISAEIGRTSLRWTRDPSAGGPVEKWLIRCGNSPGAYTIQVEVPDPAMLSIPTLQVVPGIGRYYCSVFAWNFAGISGGTPEITFVAGKRVDPATEQTLQIK